MGSNTVTADLKWATGNIDQQEGDLGPVNWKAMLQYALQTKCQRDGSSLPAMHGKFSSKYNKGGRNVVRLIEYQDGTLWIARLRFENKSPEQEDRMLCEVHTMTVVRLQSSIPIPEVYAYESTSDNPVGIPFILMEFIPGNTAIDSFGGYQVHGGETPQKFKLKHHTAMADVQVQMSAVRFSQIGTIVIGSDGKYTIGPIPKIGGPFNTAADFFDAWASSIEFRYSKDFIRQRTPPQYYDKILESIMTFPQRVRELARHHSFLEGPFPVFHTDFFKSNIIIDSQHSLLAVIDWEDALIVPWEMVEFATELTVIPPAMDGPFHIEDERTGQLAQDRSRYVKLAQEVELTRGIDSKFSSCLGDEKGQNFAHALWLYQKDGRIGFYSPVLDEFIQSRKPLLHLNS